MSLIEKAAQKKKGQERSLLERVAQRGTGPAEETADKQKSPPKAYKAAPTDKAPGKASRVEILDLDALEEAGIVVPGRDTTVTAEEFRIVKRSLLLNAFGRGQAPVNRGNLILVTSAQPGEGKTFCAVNLALSIACERDLTVLLVDADFAKPDVLRRLGVRGGKGLVDVISEPDVDLGDCIIRTNIPNFSILPAGRHHNLTTELLASERMGEIVDELSQRYSDRVIIFDSPPLLASSAGAVLALHVGQLMFVVESDRTTDEDVREALALVNDCEHISLLLNKQQFRTPGRFGSYYGYPYGGERKT